MLRCVARAGLDAYVHISSQALLSNKVLEVAVNALYRVLGVRLAGVQFIFISPPLQLKQFTHLILVCVHMYVCVYVCVCGVRWGGVGVSICPRVYSCVYGVYSCVYVRICMSILSDLCLHVRM